MSEFIWTWTKGNKKVFTMDDNYAEKARVRIS